MKKGILLIISLFLFLGIITNCATTRINEPIDSDSNAAITPTPEEVATEVVRGKVVLKQVDEEAEKQEREARATATAAARKAMEDAEAKAKRAAEAKAAATAKAKERATIQAMKEAAVEATATAVARAEIDKEEAAKLEKEKMEKGRKWKKLFLLFMGLLVILILILIIVRDRKKKDDDNGIPGYEDEPDTGLVDIEETVFTEDESAVAPPEGGSSEVDFADEKQEMKTEPTHPEEKPSAEEEAEAAVEADQEKVNEEVKKSEQDPSAVPEMTKAVDEMNESVDSMNKAADEMREKVISPKEEPAVEEKAPSQEEQETPPEEEIVVQPPEKKEPNPAIESAVAAMAEEKKEEPEPAADDSIVPGASHISPNKVNAGEQGSTLHIYYKPGQDITDYVTLIVEVPEGWKKPSRDAGSSGYFSAEVNEGKVISLSDEGKVMEVELYGLTANSEVKITYGDKSGGGPGLNIPTIKGEAVFKVRSGVKGTPEMAEIADNPIIEVG